MAERMSLASLQFSPQFEDRSRGGHPVQLNALDRLFGNVVTSVANLARVPGDVLAGRYRHDPATPGVITEEDAFLQDLYGRKMVDWGPEMALSTFGAFGLTGGPARLGSGLSKPAPNTAPAVPMASRSASLYNPPERPPRPFGADYPQGTRADASGRLTHDVEGRPLTAERVVGRRVVGGKDEALAPAEFDTLTEALIGRRSEVAPLRREAGHYEKRPLSRREWGELTPRQQSGHTGFTSSVRINRRLSPQDAQMVHAHELGHVINDIAGTDRLYTATKSGRQIPFGEIPVSKEMGPELSAIYRDLNNGKSPKDFGYAGDDVRSELMAEAIRAYMADPNYIKTVAPKTAAAIRAHVNVDQRLNRTIQFNTIGAAAGAGATLGAIPSAVTNDDIY